MIWTLIKKGVWQLAFCAHQGWLEGGLRWAQEREALRRREAPPSVKLERKP